MKRLLASLPGTDGVDFCKKTTIIIFVEVLLPDFARISSMHDLIIRNAQIIDGSGSKPYLCDLAIKDGKIACLGEGLFDSRVVINADGLTLTPGWIDSHSHSDKTIVSFPDQKEKVEQGVTFSITGQCGSSPALHTGQDGECKTVGEFLREAVQIPQGSSAALLVGHGTIRKAVLGSENRAPTTSELSRMKALLREGMESGAIGMSLGLTYSPGCYANTDELIALAGIVGEHGGVLAAHLRNEGDSLVESTEEFLAIIKAAGCRGVISHHKAMEPRNWGKVKKTLAMIDQANAEGADVYFDIYPYCASSTSLIARFVPRQFHPEGTVDQLALLSDPQICAAIKKWGTERWGADLNWTVVSSCPGRKEYEGLSISEIAKRRGQEDQYETAFDVIRESDGRAYGCFFLASEDDLQYVLRHPRAMIGTDSSVAGNLTYYHPRLRAAFPRALARYVRELAVLPLEEMIRRMTSLPASVYGLEGKGKVEVGADADLCIFDANEIQDCADYANCSAPNKGLRYVIVDGKIVLEQGVYNHTRAGKVYLRKN